MIGRTLTLLAGGVVLAAMLPWNLSAETPAAPPVQISVAILEPDVSADLPAGERQTIAGTIDTLLTSSLAEQKGFTIIDRQLLEHVLSERAAKAGGLTKLDPGEVQAPLRPFWAAGVLVCVRVDVKDGTAVLEAVSAQTGQLLAAIYAGGKVRTPADLSTLLEPRLPAFCAAITAKLADQRGKPLVEVGGRLAAGLERSQWLVDEACEAARARVTLVDGLALLVPRQPLVTREERLLRVMGLSRPADGDAAAGLCAAPDATVLVTVTERSQPGLAFDDTPLELALRVGDQGETFRGTAGRFDDCLKAALAWLDPQLRKLSGGAAAGADDTDRARRLAQQTLAAVAAWQNASGDSLQILPPYIRARLLATASRAAHLDPTDESAAWLVVALIIAEKPDAADAGRQRRVMLEGLKFLDRFPKTAWARRDYIAQACATAGLWVQSQGGKRFGTFEDFLQPPDPEQYAVARPAFRIMAAWAMERRRRYGPKNGNNYEVFTRRMISDLIPHVPADKLDEEYQWWKRFFAEQVNKLPDALALNGCDRAAPWELIDAAFAVRRKDVATVREKLQAAACKVPQTETWVWGGDKNSPFLVPIFLRAAGDPEWQHWNLEVKAVNPEAKAVTAEKVTLNDMSAFVARLSPRSTDYWDLAQAPEPRGVEFAVPEAVRQAGFKKGSETSCSVAAFAVAAGDLWLKTPGTRPGGYNAIVRVFVARMTGTAGALADAVEMTWPQADRLEGEPVLTAHAVTTSGSQTSVWLGTSAHGLARFDRIDGRWVGRWYTTRHGLPSNGVTQITTCRNHGRDELLVTDIEGKRSFTKGKLTYSGPLTMVWTLDPATVRSTLVYDGGQDSDCIQTPAAELADGRKVLLELFGQGAYQPTPDVADIRRVVASGYSWLSENAAPFTLTKSGGRIWKVVSGNSGCITELSTATLQVLRGGSPGEGAGRSLDATVGIQVGQVLGAITWLPGCCRSVAGDDWPKTRPVWAVGRGEVLWLAFNSDPRSWDYSRAIVGYRPAPPGAKDWAAEDLWIGPFITPSKDLIYGFQPDGPSGLLLSTARHVLLLDSDQLIEQARRQGRLHSTAEWRTEQRQRLARLDWQSLVPRLILDRQWAEAGQVLDRQAREAYDGGKTEEELRVLIWRARLLAEQKDHLDEALRMYDTMAAHPSAGPPGEAFARANQIVLLYQAGRWQELVDLIPRVQERFPQMDAGGPRGPAWYLAEARKKLAAKP